MCILVQYTVVYSIHYSVVNFSIYCLHKLHKLFTQFKQIIERENFTQIIKWDSWGINNKLLIVNQSSFTIHSISWKYEIIPLKIWCSWIFQKENLALEQSSCMVGTILQRSLQRLNDLQAPVWTGRKTQY